MKMIPKRFSSSSAGVISEKGIRKTWKMFWHKTSMRKPFFGKATCSSAKKNFSIYFFLDNFKNVQKKKTFRQIISRACFDEYFYRYVLKVDENYLQNSFKTIFFKMLWAYVWCQILWKIFFILSTIFELSKLVLHFSGNILHFVK